MLIHRFERRPLRPHEYSNHSRKIARKTGKEKAHHEVRSLGEGQETEKGQENPKIGNENQDF
jgi:hypothetical protein